MVKLVNITFALLTSMGEGQGEGVPIIYYRLPLARDESIISGDYFNPQQYGHPPPNIPAPPVKLSRD